jgi:hypothetical protein
MPLCSTKRPSGVDREWRDATPRPRTRSTSPRPDYAHPKSTPTPTASAHGSVTPREAKARADTAATCGRGHPARKRRIACPRRPHRPGPTAARPRLPSLPTTRCEAVARPPKRAHWPIHRNTHSHNLNRSPTWAEWEPPPETPGDHSESEPPGRRTHTPVTSQAYDQHRSKAPSPARLRLCPSFAWALLNERSQPADNRDRGAVRAQLPRRSDPDTVVLAPSEGIG